MRLDFVRQCRSRGYGDLHTDRSLGVCPGAVALFRKISVSPEVTAARERMNTGCGSVRGTRRTFYNLGKVRERGSA